MADVIEVDTIQLVAGEIDDLQQVFQDRVTDGWTIYYLFNVDNRTFTVVYAIWKKTLVETTTRSRAKHISSSS